MKSRSIVFLFIIMGLLVSCNSEHHEEKRVFRKSKPKPKIKREGLIEKRRSDGSLKTSINYRSGKKQGLAISYYSNGKVRQKINYNEGIKHGNAETYYENGHIYQITSYKNGYKHGVRKRFRQNGKLYSEMPYYLDHPTVGLKEYTTSGEQKKKYPEITVEAIDQILTNDSYILRISMSDNSKKVEYYIGELTEDKYIGNDAIRMVSQRPGVLELRYNMPKGTFIMEEPNIIAKVTTKLKNIYITQKTHSVSIENRGY